MKAVVFTLGCKVNFCESSQIINGLKSKGYEVSDELGYADLYVLNTCAVTREAEKKSRQAIARIRKFNGLAPIYVLGCASQKKPEDFLKKQGVKVVMGTSKKDKILSMLDKEGVFVESDESYFQEFMPVLKTKSKSFVKIQDGCNNFCSYCIIPYLRGRCRSRKVDSVIGEINYLNPLEVVLTGINLSAYNDDGVTLSDLLLKLKDLKTRIRLGSLEVNVLDEKFLKNAMQLYDFAPHFHLSLQSGCDKILKDMNRRYTTADYKRAVQLIRKYFSDAAITTDIIVGYPTETEEDFRQTLEFVEEIGFSDIHCFPFSPREGTKAYDLKDLSAEVKNDRLDRLMQYKKSSKNKFINKNVGKILSFLPETEKDGYLAGYSENYIRVYAKGDFVEKIVKVKVLRPYLDGVEAEIIKE
ncbi:MAG: tRNA (N(6)-L-threonylcarbamoyladenosine(37)-C(2))-methylthiotransferase MtaB [Christensenellaceae bacterium]